MAGVIEYKESILLVPVYKFYHPALQGSIRLICWNLIDQNIKVVEVHEHMAKHINLCSDA